MRLKFQEYTNRAKNKLGDFDMNKKISVVALTVLAVMATGAFAAWLIGSQEVQTCTDTDGGLNYLTMGAIHGLDRNGTPYNLTDYCISNATIAEHACYINTTNNKTYAVRVGESCTAANKTFCSAGKCW